MSEPNIENKNPIMTADLAKQGIPVVLAADDNFAAVAGVCLKSIAKHASSAESYNITILETNISSYNKKLLADMLQPYQNFSLCFYNVESLISGHRLKPSEYISVETYYRFLIQDILPKADKAIYLDCDLIVLADVAELYRQNLNDCLLAAVRDPDILGQLNLPSSTMKKYAVEDLGLKDPYDYFQAGVLVLNLTEMRVLHSITEWLDLASKTYRYADQDVLNKCCQERVKYLDMAWNVLFDCDWRRIAEVIEYAPPNIYWEYMESRKNPKIIHFAGFKKPWQVPGEDFGEVFWKYARETPFYEILLYRMAQQKPQKTTKKDEKPKLLIFANKLLPKGSRRRSIIKKIFKTPIKKYMHKVG